MERPVIGLPLGNLESRQIPHLGLPRAYAEALAVAGAVAAFIPPLADERALRSLYRRLDGLLLCGGGDLAAELYGQTDSGTLSGLDPERDRSELQLARWALADGLPILGICRGIQALNIAAGGTLIQDIPSQVQSEIRHRTPPTLPRDHIAHSVCVTSGSLLGRLCGLEPDGSDSIEAAVNSTHHQAVDRVASGFAVCAQAPDGVVEGIERTDGAGIALGVQWHPEAFIGHASSPHRTLFEQFVARCPVRGER